MITFNDPLSILSCFDSEYASDFTDVNECAFSEICDYGGACINTYGSYACIDVDDLKPIEDFEEP